MNSMGLTMSPGRAALLAGIGTIGAYLVYSRIRRSRQKPAWDRDIEYKDDVVYLYMFPRSIGKQVPNVSPFGVKVEMWLRMHDIQYELVPAGTRDGPKQQVPFIRFNGQVVADSDRMINFLAENFKVDADDGLDAESDGVAHAFGKMLDENTCWTYFLYRYVWHADLFARVFRVSNSLRVHRAVRFFGGRRIKKRSICHGIGRNSEEDVLNIARGDLRAISQWLGDKRYFMGDKPGKIDATLFGHLCQVLYVVDMPYPQRNFLKHHCPNVVEYLDRLKAEFWPDWDSIVDSGTFDDW